MSKFSALFALCLSFYCVLPALSLTTCKINLKNDLNENHPLLLRQNSAEFYYPSKCKSNLVKLRFKETLRAVCPQDDLQVGNNELNRAEANLKCYAANFFQVGRAFSLAPLKNIACASAPVATLSNTSTSCPNGVIGRIGFQLENDKWANTIDRICHQEATGRSHWAHHKLPGAIRNRQSSEGGQADLKTGPFYSNIEMTPNLFTRDSQRERLNVLLEEQAKVDMIMPATATNIVTTGMLAPADDMFYTEQQASTYYYANTVPVWSSIRDGNWKKVEDVIRGLARRSCKTLDVYSGGFDTLTYKNKDDMDIEFTLTTTTDAQPSPALPVPRYLFRYVIDRSSNRGLAFITVNDPMLAIPPAATDLICEEYAECASKFPEFKTAAQGYTYCCTIGKAKNSFSAKAMELGLPTYPNAKPLKFNAASKEDNLNPLLQALLPDGFLEDLGISIPNSFIPKPSGLFFNANDVDDDDEDDDFDV